MVEARRPTVVRPRKPTAALRLDALALEESFACSVVVVGGHMLTKVEEGTCFGRSENCETSACQLTLRTDTTHRQRREEVVRNRF